MTENLLQYGVLGVAVVAMSTFIMHLLRSHKEERSQWLNSYKENTEATNKNTTVIEGLKTLLESIERRK